METLINQCHWCDCYSNGKQHTFTKDIWLPWIYILDADFIWQYFFKLVRMHLKTVLWHYL